MTDIFISYASEDQERVASIVQALRAADYSVWWDRDIEPGVDRKVAIAEHLAEAKLNLVAWSRAAADPVAGKDVIDEAEHSNGRGAYLGVMLDQVELPFGFGGHEAVDVAPFKGSANEITKVVAGVKKFMEEGQAILAPLPPPPEYVPPSKMPLYLGIGAGVAVVLALIAYAVIRMTAPTTREIVETKLAGVPCSWLRVDPVDDGSKGTLALIGVSGDPANAGVVTQQLIQQQKLGVKSVTTDKIAQIDPRECAAIDEPLKLRKSPGGRLTVTGEPYILDTTMAKPQALARVQIALTSKDSSMALFGVEPSGEVTWILPDKASLEALKNFDVGYKNPEEGHYEFNVYPDHTGWTGLFLIVGDKPLAKLEPQLTKQHSAAFVQDLHQATAGGNWDSDMFWFRIDKKK
jgi:hypothetical protein